MAPPTSSDRVQQTVSRIEADNQNHDAAPKKLHEELDQLRREDMVNGKLNQSQYKADLKAVNDKLHSDGVLPQLDIVESGNGEAALRGIAQPGKTPTDGQASLTTKAHGTTFTYDTSGHVESYSKGKDTWTYSNKDGLYHETVDGKKTQNTTSDIIEMGANGVEHVTHDDGSTTTVSKWGGTIDRNAQGLMTKEVRGKDVKTFQYDSAGNLNSMTDRENGKQPVTYNKGSDGKFYAEGDNNHQNPLDITVEPDKNPDGSQKQNGVVEVTDKNGNSTDYHWGGTAVHYNSQKQLTEIDYSNGNKATGFKYDANDPTQLNSFKISGQDGKTHTYADDNGMISVDGGKAVKGSFTVGAQGSLKVTETGDGSDSQYKETRFGLGGSEVELGKYGGNIEPDKIVSYHGKVSSFKYDTSGQLEGVDAHGYNLQFKNNQWVDASGNPAKVTPSIDQNGNFSVTQPDGTFTTWNPDGTMSQGIPDTAQAIKKEAQDAAAGQQNANPNANGDTTATTSSFHDPRRAVAYQGDMTIDLDGKGTPTGGDNQNQTSYADGRLSAWNTNYVALAPGWAAAHGLHLGDVVAVRHDGKTAYAIYGDNYMGNAVHTEGSIHLARALNPGNGTDNTLPNVQFYALPGSGDLLHGSVSQAAINRVGQQLFA